MKTLLATTLLTAALTGAVSVSAAWANENANDTIVVSYTYSSHAGILP